MDGFISTLKHTHIHTNTGPVNANGTHTTCTNVYCHRYTQRVTLIVFVIDEDLKKLNKLNEWMNEWITIITDWIGRVCVAH